MSNIDPSTWNPDWELNEQIEGIPLDADASILDSWKAFRMLMAAIGTHGQTLIQKVSGPSSSVDEHIVLFDGTSGLKLKDSGLSLSDIAANPFTGATASAAGTTGLVPQPLAGDQDKVLRGDGTWGAIVASDVPNIPASKITSGTIDLARLPAGALERLVTVADQTARFALTTASVQLGDTVKQLDTGIMYLVVDTAKLNQAAGYVEYTAGSAASVPWSGVTGKPSSYTPSSHTHGSITNDGKLGTASRVVVTDGDKKIAVSGVTATELGYLSGVTSAVQTQLNGKVSKSGDTMTGTLNYKPNNINLDNPPSSNVEKYCIGIIKSDAQTVNTGNYCRFGVVQEGNSKDYRITLGVSNPRAGNIPTATTIANGDDDADAYTGNCWGFIGVQYDYSKNRAYPIFGGTGYTEYDSSDDSSFHIPSTRWVRRAAGDFACNAATATKLATARTIGLIGAVSGTVNFDGSANVSVSTQRRGCLVGQSEQATDNPWYKVAEFSVGYANDDIEIVFLVEDTYSSNNSGILRVHVRTDGSKKVTESSSVIEWLSETGFVLSHFVLVLPTTASPTVEIWTCIAVGYMGRRFTVLSEGSRSGSFGRWTLLDTGLTRGQAASITTAGTQKTSVLAGLAFADINGLQIDTGYLKKTGGTLTGDLYLDDKSLYRKSTFTRGVAPSSDVSGWLCGVKDSAGNSVTGIQNVYYTDKSVRTRLMCYRGTTADNTWFALELGYDASGNKFTSAPTPSDYDASNNIATTAFVYRNAARHRLSDVTYYVSNASGASGDGSTLEKAMSVQDMWLMLSTIHMQPTAGSCDNSRSVTLKFVRTGTSYGTVRIDASKMPGVRFLTVTNATGTDSTTSNWSTNSPEFSNFLVNGSGLQVTLRNVYVSGTVWAEYHGRLTIDTFVGAGRFVAHNYSRIDFADNVVVNVHNIGTDYLATSYEFGYVRLNGNIMTFNFREQCYFNGAIFRTDGCGRLYVDYTRLKLTGTQPVVAINVSGTKTGHSSTAAGTAAKVVTLESGQTFSLAANAVAYVTFDNTNTAANPTLNINNTGAKAIWVNGAAIPAKYLNKHIQYKFTYDGTRYVCNNTFQRVEVAGQNSLFHTSGNYDQTYNSGSWNWNGFINWYGTGAVANGIVSGNVTGTSANVTGTVVVGHGGTGATTREDACKNLFQKNMGSSGIAHFLTGTSSFADSGYSSVADVKTILGLKSAAYTESSAYAASGHTHSYLPLSGGTLTGDTFITKDNPKILLRNSKIVKGVTQLESNNFNRGFSFRDANNVEFGAIEHAYYPDKTNRFNFIAYKGTSTVTNDGNCRLSVGFDGNGNWFTEAPTPGVNDNSTKIATTAWVRTHVANSGSSSDERLKTPLSAVPDEVLDAWGAVELGQFKFLSAIDCKGEAARLHLGMIAQRVQKVFEVRGLDACTYGILCHEEYPATYQNEAGEQWTVRYTEALCMEAMYQRRRADRLEARIATLEEAINV